MWLFELLERIVGESRRDRPRLDQRHMDARAFQLHALHQHQAFQREFGCDIGAAPFHRHEAKDGRAVDDPAMALLAHDGNKVLGQFMPTEEIGVELFAQSGDRQIFHRAGQGIGAIVEEGIERAAGFVQTASQARQWNPVRDSRDSGRTEPSAFNAFDIRWLPRGGEDGPAIVLSTPAHNGHLSRWNIL